MSEAIRTFHDLAVWRKAHQLAKEVFDLAETFPRRYAFDLASQLKRAALSIPTNLAEGSATQHSRELIQFLNVAKRSVSEVQYLILFATERGLLKEELLHTLNERDEEVNRMVGGLRRSLNSVRRSSASTRHSALATRH